MNGGKLIQDCSGHAIGYTHSIVGLDNFYIYEITSTHHQMQYPFCIPDNQWDCLYLSQEFRSRYYSGDGIIGRIPYEPEIVLYHRDNKPKCLAIQGHPEYMQKDSPIVIRLNEIINKLLEDEN